MVKVAGIVLARMDSSRFPGKALSLLGGIPLLERCFSGVLRSHSFTPILATTMRAIDQPLVDFAENLGIPCFRGSLDNVYKRVCECLEYYDVDIFARINGDSPFVQAELLDSALTLLEDKNCDFVTNLIPRRFPYGISTEIFRSEIFIHHTDKIETPEHKEHITSYFYQNLTQLKYTTISGTVDLSRIRLTVDTQEDLNFIEQMLGQDSTLFEQPLVNIVKVYQEQFSLLEKIHNEVMT